MAERDPVVEAALVRAGEELGLDPCYRDCVRPLLTMPEKRWPQCCGGACEPCSQLLVNVALRVRALTGASGDPAG